MQNKNVLCLIAFLCGTFMFSVNSFAEDVVVEEDIVTEMEEISADAVANYQVDGSLFQQITDLEQEKVLMQLEKERAQLDLELDRLAAEKIKLHMEIDTLSGRAEQQQQEIETQKAKLEAEAARIEREKEAWLKESETQPVKSSASNSDFLEDSPKQTEISKKYRLVNVVGAGSQLQATIEDLSSGQTRRIGVGKELDGLTIKSISLYDGVVFSDKDGKTQSLNISNGI